MAKTAQTLPRQRVSAAVRLKRLCTLTSHSDRTRKCVTEANRSHANTERPWVERCMTLPHSLLAAYGNMQRQHCSPFHARLPRLTSVAATNSYVDGIHACHRCQQHTAPKGLSLTIAKRRLLRPGAEAPAVAPPLTMAASSPAVRWRGRRHMCLFYIVSMSVCFHVWA